MTSLNDGSSYPNELTVEDLWLVRLDPQHFEPLISGLSFGVPN